MSKTSMTISSILVALLLCLRSGSTLPPPDADGDSSSGTPTLCAYVYHDVVKEMASKSSPMPSGPSEDVVEGRRESLQGVVFADNRTIRCAKATDFCYTLWIEDAVNNTLAPRATTLLAQGCWESSGEYDCRGTECVSVGRPMKAMNNTKFCCCSGDMCNRNMTVSDELMAPLDSDRALSTAARPSLPSVEQASRDRETLYTALASLACAIGLGFITFFAYRRWVRLRKPSPDAVHLVESGPGGGSSSPAFDLDNLKLHEVVGRGRYGTVWRASLNDGNVAVKIFPGQHRNCFLNERDIYSLPFMDHVSLLRFLGSEERATADGRPEYHLVVSYAPVGCLQEYLRANVTDWPTLCRMSQSVARGLAHLHTDIRKGNLTKPCITHRDLNSRNVLVNVDLSCVLCDLGFAMKIAGSRYYSQGGEEQHAETTSLTDVGTLRYMAPEVLEGAVNLRDCESSLKQIDVYALGLILWEVATRCSDLYQGLEVPDYRMPFEAEIGSHPTFEQMQVLISRNKARPLFPDVWKDTNQAVRLLKETIEDCWDQDAEARLTSLCVEERLQELPVLWERHRASFGASGVSPTVNPTCCQTTTTCRSSAPNDYDETLAANCCRVTDVNSGCEGSTSEATAETTVTVSPPAIAEPEQPLSKNANNRCFSRAPLPLQPHQGRNPCLERNMMEPLEEISVSGNTLLGKGVRGCKNSVNRRNGDHDVEELFEAVGAADATESNSLVNHDHLGGLSNRICNPIPYVQNAVCKATATPLPTQGNGATHHHPRPKRLNVPGNGWHHQPNGIAAAPKAVAKETGGSNGGGVLRSLLDWARKRKAKSTGGGGGGGQDEVDGEDAEDEEENVYEDTEDDPAKASVQTKVCLIPGRRRGGDSAVRTVVESGVPNGRCARGDDADNHRQRRPNTLPLRGVASPGSMGHGYRKVHTTEPLDRNVDPGGDDDGDPRNNKISQRVKTPYELIKSGRFSLYDDRMMSSSSPSQDATKRVKDKNVYSISVPVDMDTLCTQQAEGFIRQFCAVDGERSGGSSSGSPPQDRRNRHRLPNPPPLPPPRSRPDTAADTSGEVQAMSSKQNGGVSRAAIYQISCL